MELNIEELEKFEAIFSRIRLVVVYPTDKVRLTRAYSRDARQFGNGVYFAKPMDKHMAAIRKIIRKQDGGRLRHREVKEDE